MVHSPAVTLSPTSLSFGYHLIGTSFGSQSVSLTNSGQDALTISSIAASSGFTETNTCGATLAAGASCTINVAFTPSVAGATSGGLTITGNAAGSPQVVSLAGIGAATPVVASPVFLGFLDFGSQPVGTAASLPVLLANAADTPLLIRRVIVAPGSVFSGVNTCGTSVAPSASCTIPVTFDPRSVGPSFGIVIILDNGRPRPVQLVRLRGEGVGAGTKAAATAAE